MTFYGALRGLSYLVRDVWAALQTAAQPRSRNDYVDHLAELLASREAETEVAEPADEAQADCGMGGYSPLDRLQDTLGEAHAFMVRITSAAPGADTPDAAADAPPPDSTHGAGHLTSTVVDPFTWAAVDGPAPSNPLPGAGPHQQLTSGDLRAGALAAREKAQTCDPADAPGWAALAHRFIQAAHAMTLAAMYNADPGN